MNLRLLFVAFLSIFTLVGHSQSIGIIGDATPGGWDADTDLIQDAVNTNLFTLDVTLTDGSAKFRKDDLWAVNWGDSAFPAGIGTQDGDNIPVFAGDYTVSLDTSTGAYNFAVASDIGIIGDATGSWDDDTNMYIDADGNYFVILDLIVGEAKFRQDDDWPINWGSADFPLGTGVQDGDNIPVSQAGTYYITFNKTTGEYNFEEVVTFASIGIIGDASPSGPDADEDMTQSTTDPNVWTMNATLNDGWLKFRANDEWAINWGSLDFPSGTAVQGGDNIPAVAGDYSISFNTETGEYSFLEVVEYASIGVIGDATGSWDVETPMDKVTDGMWELRMILSDGELKFRANNDWPINWGAGDFPTGVGVQDGANVPILAGEYNITFNSITGEYNFEEIVVYSTVGIIGTGSPTMGWDDDTDLTADATDEYLFTGTFEIFDGEVKFRAEDDWAVNWGAVDFPVGVGTQDGPNIMSLAGTYAISLVTDTGEYAFTSPDRTQDILSPNAVKIYPNPAQGLIRLEMDDERLQGEVQITIVDITGQVLINKTLTMYGTATMDVSSLVSGNYSVRIQNGKTLVGKKLTIVE